MNKDSEAWTKLRDSLEIHDFDIASQILSKFPKVIQLRDGIGETVLHFLAVENNIDSVVWLHRRGADISTKNKFGTPVLFEIAQLNYQDLFLTMLALGADSTQLSDSGESIFEYLEEYEKFTMITFIKKQMQHPIKRRS